ncbi:MAG TPA: YfiR family protein [Candidatus Acidoferrum sp.]|nr:YfiR family protein [Candidatus Acidoferrum sp.]
MRLLRAIHKWFSCPGTAPPRRNECNRMDKLALTINAFILVAVLVLPLPSRCAQPTNANEYREKAAFLAAFPNFVEWPADAFPSAQAPVYICVFGDFSFGTSLAELTRGVLIHGRRVEIRWVRQEQALRTCHILFVSRSEGKRYAKIFKVIQGANVLTVGETSDFMASGGAIDFLIEEDRLQFEVNIRAANDAHLRISSNMLALAHHIVTKMEAARN